MSENLAGVENERTIISYVQHKENGEPYIQGTRCGNCGETYVGPRMACANCFATDQMQEVELATTGKLYNWTIVYRNFPGVKVPFISAIVDLDGGGSLKGNLLDVEPDPDNIEFDMPVDVIFKHADNTDAEGNHYLSFFFVPSANEE